MVWKIIIYSDQITFSFLIYSVDIFTTKWYTLRWTSDMFTTGSTLYIDGLVQERRNSSALAMELCLSCTNPSIWKLQFMHEVVRTSSKCRWGIYRTPRKRRGTLRVVHKIDRILSTVTLYMKICFSYVLSSIHACNEQMSINVILCDRRIFFQFHMWRMSRTEI